MINADFLNGVVGIAALLVISVLIGAAFGAAAVVVPVALDGLVLLARWDKPLIALMQFLIRDGGSCMHLDAAARVAARP